MASGLLFGGVRTEKPLTVLGALVPAFVIQN
jgi:hypothetical protein